MEQPELTPEENELLQGFVNQAASESLEIESLWVLVAVKANGDEGIPVVKRGSAVIPVLTGCESNLPAIRALAKNIVEDNPKSRLILRQFTTYMDIEEFRS